MKVDPSDIISPTGGAEVSHDGTTTITVTITSDTGDEVTIQVPPNTIVRWVPPAGWDSATFNSPGHAELFRLIQ